MGTRTERVVVGVDGSETSSQALAWAVDEARRRSAHLHLVHAWIWPLMNVPLGPAPGAPEGAGFRGEAEKILADASAEATRLAPDVPHTAELIDGAPAQVLVRVSRDADLLVVGSRGLGGFTGMLLGSSALSAASHASCPVAVVRGTLAPDRPVLVGISPSEDMAPVLQLAFDAARRRGVALSVAQVIEPPLATYGIALGVNDVLEAERSAAQGALDEFVAPWREQNPDVPVTTTTLLGSPGGALCAASAGAQLVVVGSRRLGGFKRMLLGSTSHALLHHAECPVLIDPHVSRAD